ncbi:MAG: hypothetical protein HY077_06650 [Elusimicrobia bacterium]|nr:hypothetical protein [Elusimicrobiota bacterium]
MRKRRDPTVLIILGALGTLEVLGIYLLIGLETPLTPYARRLTSNVFGLFALAMIVFTTLAFGMAFLLSILEGRRRGLNKSPKA